MGSQGCGNGDTNRQDPHPWNRTEARTTRRSGPGVQGLSQRDRSTTLRPWPGHSPGRLEIDTSGNQASLRIRPAQQIPTKSHDLPGCLHRDPIRHFVYGEYVPRVKIGKNALPVAIDWSAPGAFYWLMSDLDDVDLIKVFSYSLHRSRQPLFCNTLLER
jgi:hypothetical protein